VSEDEVKTVVNRKENRDRTSTMGDHDPVAATDAPDQLGRLVSKAADTDLDGLRPRARIAAAISGARIAAAISAQRVGVF
jgi:hypothetical protein